MATLTIRGLDDQVRDQLRVRAAMQGRSMEAEARAILIEAVSSPIERSLADILLGMRDARAGEHLDLPSRTGEVRDPFG